MKGLSVVLVILLFVTGVAVTGSRAQPLLRPSPLVGICDPSGPVALESRCKPIGIFPTVGEMEQVTGDTAGNLAGDTGADWANEAGGDYSDPEFLVAAARAVWEVAWKAGVVTVVAGLVEEAMDWAFGGEAPSGPSALTDIDTTIFDPDN